MSKPEVSDQDFLADLIDDEELAGVLGVQPQSIPVMRARGKLNDIRYYKPGRRGRSSRRDAIAHVRASLIPMSETV